ncbi:MAG: FecR family protein [Bacteroidota bacterium]
MEDNNKHIDHLIARYLAGESSKPETAELLEWMEASDENTKYFEDIRFLADKAVASHKIEKVDVDRAWGKVKHEMHTGAAPSTTKNNEPPKRFPGWMRYAASIIILVGLSIWLYFQYLGNPAYEEVTLAEYEANQVLQMADSNTVILQPGSKIRYPATTSRKQYKIHLQGEAYFKIEHHQEAPLTIVAERTIIQDIGTEFNVKAFPERSTVEVFVKQGEVLFFTNKQEGIHILPGETGVYDKERDSFSKKSTSNTIITYGNRMIIFEDVYLDTVIDQLNTVYGEKITLSPAVTNCKITVSFMNEDLNTILEIIAETLNLQVKYTPEGYALQGEGCNSIN